MTVLSLKVYASLSCLHTPLMLYLCKHRAQHYTTSVQDVVHDVPAIGAIITNYVPHSFSADLGELSGVLVEHVTRGSPADKSGLKNCRLSPHKLTIQTHAACLMNLDKLRRGVLEDYSLSADIIIAINGKRTPNRNELLTQIRQHNIGDLITLTVQRGEETLELPLALEAKAKLYN